MKLSPGTESQSSVLPCFSGELCWTSERFPGAVQGTQVSGHARSYDNGVFSHVAPRAALTTAVLRIP